MIHSTRTLTNELRAPDRVEPGPRRDHSPEAWGAIATGYDRTVTPSHMAIAREGLRRARVGPTTRFLDVAAGSGALAVPAARLGASVVAIDLSSAMLERLEARARQEGLEIETQVMNGEDLELDDDSFDVAGSQFGVMLFRDMRRALREMVRVVQPGGRVLVNAYGDPDEIEFLDFLVRAVRPVRPEFEGPPTDPPPLEFQLSDPATLRAALRDSGLRDVSVETVIETTEYESGEALWDWIVSSNPIVEKILGGMLGLAPEERLTVRGNLETLVRERMAGRDRARLSAPVNIGIGTR